MKNFPPLIFLLIFLFSFLCSSSCDVSLPSGFSALRLFPDSSYLMTVRFSRTGVAFVASRTGEIFAYPNIDSSKRILVASLQSVVYDWWDRGLMSLAVDPDYPVRPFIYVSYAFDGPINGSAPTFNDGCSTPVTGCTASGRISQLRLDSNHQIISEKLLISNEFCNQFSSHSMGGLEFGNDGYLFASNGEGASFTEVDYGQLAGNPCKDPPRMGGALRSQCLLRPSNERICLNGAILRLNPDTGMGAPGNPIESNNINLNRIIAGGLRNPFRFSLNPTGNSNELWISDVGWANWEEINKFTFEPRKSTNSITPSEITNFGWPCYEARKKSNILIFEYCLNENSNFLIFFYIFLLSGIRSSIELRCDESSNLSAIIFCRSSFALLFLFSQRFDH